MALDQLLLATVERLGHDADCISIVRTGSRMDPAAEPFSRRAFDASHSAGTPHLAGTSRSAGLSRGGGTQNWRAWNGHVEDARLVAANFTMLTYPRGAYPGVFDYVIADEVSMANVPSLIAATYYATTGVAFGGDPFQLPPIYPDDAEVPNDWYRANVFEMAEVCDRHDPRVAFLDTQYRMQREIGDLVSDLFYGGELKTGTALRPVLPTFGGRVVFVQSTGRVQYSEALAGEFEDERRFNEPHASDVAGTVVSLLGAGVKGADIGIITPYNAQVVTIAGKLRTVLGERHKALKQIKVSTVHSFQGQERRAIIVDFTDDNVRPTRLTAKWELVNVALSRAKEQLVIVGNRSYLTNEEFFSPAEVEVFDRMLSHASIDA
jgi:superfamily I DNA and/or RNA helicase